MSSIIFEVRKLRFFVCSLCLFYKKLFGSFSFPHLQKFFKVIFLFTLTDSYKNMHVD